MNFVHVSRAETAWLRDGPSPREYFNAAAVPLTVEPQSFDLWEIRRIPLDGLAAALHCGNRHRQTILFRWTDATLHLDHGELVMEDSDRELGRHMPLWLAARGRILVTGLGLGCVVRGLLLNPEVEHVDVVEIDPGIIRVIGAEFAGCPRVTIHEADALQWPIPAAARWDYAWHDLWCPDNDGLQRLHTSLIKRFRPHVTVNQGAWEFPRWAHRLVCRNGAGPLLGGPTRRRRAPQ